MSVGDIALLLLWCAVLVCNKAAIVPLVVMLVNMASFEVFDRNFEVYLIGALCCFISATVKINMVSSARFCIALLGLTCAFGAVDSFLSYHYNILTVYYDVVPYLITGFNALLAALLLTSGGLNIVDIRSRFTSIVRDRMARL